MNLTSYTEQKLKEFDTNIAPLLRARMDGITSRIEADIQRVRDSYVQTIKETAELTFESVKPEVTHSEIEKYEIYKLGVKDAIESMESKFNSFKE